MITVCVQQLSGIITLTNRKDYCNNFATLDISPYLWYPYLTGTKKNMDFLWVFYTGSGNKLHLEQITSTFLCVYLLILYQ